LLLGPHAGMQVNPAVLIESLTSADDCQSQSRAGRDEDDDDDDVCCVSAARDVDSVTICLRVVVVRTVTPGCGCCNTNTAKR